MANPEHFAKLREGPEAWNVWRWIEHADAVPDLSGAKLNRAYLRGADLSGADLSGAYLSGADLGGAYLSGADLREANFSGAYLREANLSGANLHGTNLGGANLSGAYLGGADLGGAHLRGANLGGAHLRGADLSEADFRGAHLRQADFAQADFAEADFGYADLRGANLRGTALALANLNQTRLRGADLQEARLLKTSFGDTDLREVKGLDNCEHFGPSIIDHRTLAMSGPLPLAFLRGCGLSDWQIEATKLNLKDLSNHEVDGILYRIAALRYGQASQFYSCFISYSTEDKEFAEQLCADLQNNGMRCWFASHQMQGGKKIDEQIDRAIHVCDRLLLILSKDSIESYWVKREIRNAQERAQHEKRRVLFPIPLVDIETLRNWEFLDADTGTDSAREIRECFIPDFSKWKDHDSYQEQFDRLLKDLKATGPAAPQ